MTFTIISVSNPVYVSEDNKQINCIVNTVEHGIVPFTATSFDSMSYGTDLYNALINNKYGVISPYVSPNS